MGQIFNDPFGFLISLLYLLPAILISLTVHEMAHGYTAHYLGDPTPKASGRLSFNPLHHIDPLGAIFLIFFRFGWAKPVTVNPLYFRNRKRDMGLTALAGPLSNFVLALLFSIVLGVFARFGVLYMGVWIYIINFIEIMISINVGLGLFNLIPAPPLDGSKILGMVLSDEAYWKMMQYDRYFMIILMVLLWFGFLSMPLSMASSFVINGFYKLASLIAG